MTILSPFQSTGSPPSSERQRRRATHRRRSEEEPVCCERCNNYNRDCCCTFSCGKCGKRVFSIGAFIGHKRLHLRPHSPPEEGPGGRGGGGFAPGVTAPLTLPIRSPKTARVERVIRPSFIERRRRKKRRRGSSKGGKKKTVELPAEAQKEIKGEGEEPALTQEVLPSASPPNAASRPSSNDDSQTATPPHPQSLEEDSLMSTGSSPPTPSATLPAEEDLEEGEDSNTGSLTDLSPFTAPNLLKPTAPVGGSGQE